MSDEPVSALSHSNQTITMDETKPSANIDDSTMTSMRGSSALIASSIRTLRSSGKDVL
jgi:hypothetical protein